MDLALYKIFIIIIGSTRAVGELQLHQELLSRLPAKTTSDHDEEPEQGPLKDDEEPAPEAASPVATPPAPEPRIRHKKFRKRQKLEEKEEREEKEGTEEACAEVITSSNVSPEKSVSVTDWLCYCVFIP